MFGKLVCAALNKHMEAHFSLTEFKIINQVTVAMFPLKVANLTYAQNRFFYIYIYMLLSEKVTITRKTFTILKFKRKGQIVPKKVKQQQKKNMPVVHIWFKDTFPFTFSTSLNMIRLTILYFRYDDCSNRFLIT